MAGFKFSNFQPSEIVIDGLTYATVEHYYQSQKCLYPDQAKEVRLASTPGKAKRLGRKMVMRSDWESVKEEVMMRALIEKFKINDYKKSLISTKEEIVEWNTWHDNEWGNCTCSKCKNKVGNNKLGKLLMKLRDQLS